MTNQTNLDYLFKLTAPVPERGAGGSISSNGRRPAFDDHLVNASASASGSSSTTARTPPTESAPLENDGRISRTQPDDGYTATKTNREPAENSTPAAAAADTIDHADEQDVGAVEEESSDDIVDESVSEQDAAQELAAAAASQIDSSLTADHLAVGAADNGDAAKVTSESTGNLDGDAEPIAGNLLATKLTSAERRLDNVAANVEVDIRAQVQNLDSSTPQIAGDHANESNSAQAAANDDNRQRRSAPGVNATTVDTASALANNVATRAETKPARAVAAGRRGAIQNNKASEERRASAATAANRADASALPNTSATAGLANVVNPQIVTIPAGEAGEEAAGAVKPIGHNAEGAHLSARAQRSGAAGSRRAHAAHRPDLPRVDAARFVGRVAKAVQTAQDRGGLVQLRLSPPELGSLRLELSMQNGVMMAAVETETPAARQVLLDHLPALRERLAEQNIRIERFDVDVRQENSGGQADPRAQQEQRQQQPQQPNSRHQAGRAASTPTASGDAPPVTTRLASSELNLLA